MNGHKTDEQNYGAKCRQFTVSLVLYRLKSCEWRRHRLVHARIEQLVQILKEPKNSLIRQYQYLFELDGILLEFENDAFLSIAEKARELKTNARGLKNILEKILLPYQFDSIDLVERGLNKIIITKASVDGSPATLIFNKKNDKKSS